MKSNPASLKTKQDTDKRGQIRAVKIETAASGAASQGVRAGRGGMPTLALSKLTEGSNADVVA